MRRADHEDMQRLSNAIRDRMAQLGWSRTDLHRQMTLKLDRVPPSLRTVDNVLDCVATPSRPTQAGLEVGLGWPPGTISDILKGAEAPTDPPPPADAGRLTLLQREVDALRRDVDWLISRATNEPTPRQ